MFSQVITTPLAKLFVGYDAELFEMTRHGFRIYFISFLINGFNIYGSAFFTALNNGMISAAISFLRTLLFQMAAVLILACILWSERNLECRYSGRALYTFYDSCIFYQTAKEISLYVKIHQSGILESVRKYNVKNSTSRRNCIV